MEVRKSYNPLTLNYDTIYSGPELSPNQLIKQEKLVFIRPVVLLVNGEPTLRQSWDIKLTSKDICHFIELPGIAAVALFIGKMILYAAISYAIGYLYNLWFGPDPIETVDAPETVYGLTAGMNRIRLGEPFPEHFGRFICYPPLIQQNYVEYIYTVTKTEVLIEHFWTSYIATYYTYSTKQHLHMIGVIGVGEYDIEGVYIDKTPLSDYSGSTYNIIPPGGSPTLIPNIVYTSAAIANQEVLFEYLTVAVSAPGTTVSEIGFDIVFPEGIIHITEKGKIYHTQIEVHVQIRKINDVGEGISSWTEVFHKTYRNTTQDILRYTEKIPVFGLARYEFRIRRGNIKTSEIGVADKCVIESLRGYGAPHPDYGDVTLIEVNIIASDKLSGLVDKKINVVCTRKLYPVISTGFGVVKEATTSIVDACAYIVTCENGGQQADATLNFEDLVNMESILLTRNNTFNHRFTTKSTVFDALKLISRCGRCIPIMPGGLFSLVRDRLQTTPSQIYTDDDYTEESLNLTHVLRTDDDSTCVEVEYTDSDSWQIQTVFCYDTGGNTDRPIKLRLIGCTDRQHAFEEGMYAFWDDQYNRTTTSMTTGLKGLIPSIGCMIYVGSRQIDWGQTGQVAHLDGTTLWLSEPIDFRDIAVEEGVMLLTRKDGNVLGPFKVYPTSDSHSVTISIDADLLYTIYTDGDKTTKFLFGITTEEILRVRVLKIIPLSCNEVKIEGSIIHDEVHYDPGEAPAIGILPFVLPILDGLIITLISIENVDYDYQINWLSSKDKFKLEIDEGSGYVLLIDNLEAYIYNFSTSDKNFDIKVTPYISGILVPTEAKTINFSVVLTPQNVTTTDNDIDLLISWDDVVDADYYGIRLEYDGNDIFNLSNNGNYISVSIQDIIDSSELIPEISIYVTAFANEIPSDESNVVVWTRYGFNLEDANTIFICKTYNDAKVSGTPILIRFINQNMDYYYIKVYPTISSEYGGTSDNFGSDFQDFIDTTLSGTPRIGKIESNSTPYYYKMYPTIALSSSIYSGITKNIINISDVTISGYPRVARVQINSVFYYFKVYPTMP